MTYDNTNTFTLGKNQRKESDKQPDYVGKIQLEGGKTMRLAAWKREGSNGPFLSGKLSEFQDDKQQPAQSTQPADDFDDDIPFN